MLFRSEFYEVYDVCHNDLLIPEMAVCNGAMRKEDPDINHCYRQETKPRQKKTHTKHLLISFQPVFFNGKVFCKILV